jgi:hypothetical protein
LDLEFKASLGYIASSRPLVSEILSQGTKGKKKEGKEEYEWGRKRREWRRTKRRMDKSGRRRERRKEKTVNEAKLWNTESLKSCSHGKTL